PGRHQFEHRLDRRQEQRPAPDALRALALVVPQAQLFDFIEVDFDLVPTVVGIDRLARIELQVARQQVPGRDRQLARDYKNEARREGPPDNYSRKKSRCNLYARHTKIWSWR